MTSVKENHHLELGTGIVDFRLPLAPQSKQNELKKFGSHRNHSCSLLQEIFLTAFLKVKSIHRLTEFVIRNFHLTSFVG